MGCKLVQLPCVTVIEYSIAIISMASASTFTPHTKHAHTINSNALQMNTNLCHCITITDC